MLSAFASVLAPNALGADEGMGGCEDFTAGLVSGLAPNALGAEEGMGGCDVFAVSCDETGFTGADEGTAAPVATDKVLTAA